VPPASLKKPSRNIWPLRIEQEAEGWVSGADFYLQESISMRKKSKKMKDDLGKKEKKEVANV
jgi:hypothetical protein